MKFTITVDETIYDNTLLKICYTGEEVLDDSTLEVVTKFVEKHQESDSRMDLVFTAVKMFYITYTQRIHNGETLSNELFDLLFEMGHSIVVDESSSEPERKWRIIKDSTSITT